MRRNSKVNAFIGLTDDNSYNDWRWSDSPATPVTFTDWHNGQPDNPDHHCVVVSKNLLYCIL